MSVESLSFNFWDAHGTLFVLFMFFFPRLTLVFSSVASGGLLWWLGWVFAPRLLVAILATTAYWHTNTFLCVLAWVWALCGEIGEKGSASAAGKGKAA
jgi:hypothetical protein